MTLSGTIPIIQSLGDAVNKIFSYGFRIDQAADLEVFQDTALQPAASYQVTGVGVDTGGTVIFGIAPASGTLVTRRRNKPLGQATSYKEGDSFLSQSHEQSVDSLAQQTTQAFETFQRVPTLGPTTVNGLRNLLLPPPVPLQLWSWDSNGTQIVYAPSTILTVTPLPGGGAVVTAQATQAVNASNGLTQLTTSGLVPAGARLTDGMAFLATEWSTENNISAWSLGTATASGRYGQNLAITQGTVTSAGQAVNFVQEPAPSGLELVVTATAGGPFGLTGQAIVTAQYVLYVPPTAVP